MTGINYLTIRDESGKVTHPGKLYSPITGCSGKGCPTKDTCWARAMVKRFPVIHEPEVPEHPGFWTPFDEVQFHPDRLEKPLHWKKPRRIGVCFMGDWMDEQVKTVWIEHIIEIMMAGPQHQFFTLTKQPQNLDKRIYGFDPCCQARELGSGDSLPNLWNGVTITSQADEWMIRELLRIPGKHWVSIEPMMGEIDITQWIPHIDWAYDDPVTNQTIYRDSPINSAGAYRINRHGKYIDWVVLGSHNRPQLHPCPHEWMIDVVEQCRAAGTPCFVKQVDMGGRVCTDITKFPKELQVRELP